MLFKDEIFQKKETLTRDYGKQESEKRDKMTIYHISDVLSGQTELSRPEMCCKTCTWTSVGAINKQASNTTTLYRK